MTPSMPISAKRFLSANETVSFLPECKDSVLNMGASYDLGLRLTLEALILMLR